MKIKFKLKNKIKIKPTTALLLALLFYQSLYFKHDLSSSNKSCLTFSCELKSLFLSHSVVPNPVCKKRNKQHTDLGHLLYSSSTEKWVLGGKSTKPTPQLKFTADVYAVECAGYTSCQHLLAVHQVSFFLASFYTASFKLTACAQRVGDLSGLGASLHYLKLFLGYQHSRQYIS